MDDELKVRLREYAELPPHQRLEHSVFKLLVNDSLHRIQKLEEALARYGDRARMAWCPDTEMQFVIDLALSNQAAG
jgi:hypothetical protein